MVDDLTGDDLPVVKPTTATAKPTTTTVKPTTKPVTTSTSTGSTKLLSSTLLSTARTRAYG